MSEPLTNPRRKVKITLLMEVPTEWTDNFIKHGVHFGTIRPITADEISATIIEDVTEAPDPNQGKLFHDA